MRAVRAIGKAKNIRDFVSSMTMVEKEHVFSLVLNRGSCCSSVFVAIIITVCLVRGRQEGE